MLLLVSVLFTAVRKTEVSRVNMWRPLMLRHCNLNHKSTAMTAVRSAFALKLHAWQSLKACSCDLMGDTSQDKRCDSNPTVNGLASLSLGL